MFRYIVSCGQGCRPKTVTKGLCCRKYEDHAFNHAHFCMYDNNVLVKPVYVKVIKEGENKYRVVALSFY